MSNVYPFNPNQSVAAVTVLGPLPFTLQVNVPLLIASPDPSRLWLMAYPNNPIGQLYVKPNGNGLAAGITGNFGPQAVLIRSFDLPGLCQGALYAVSQLAGDIEVYIGQVRV